MIEHYLGAAFPAALPSLRVIVQRPFVVRFPCDRGSSFVHFSPRDNLLPALAGSNICLQVLGGVEMGNEEELDVLLIMLQPGSTTE